MVYKFQVKRRLTISHVCFTQDGTPLQGDNRFCDGDRVPWASLRDALTGLFFSKPGYFRTVAFVVTDEINFGSDEKATLPPVDESSTLSPDIVQTKFKGMNCYALVYEFRKQPGESKGEKIIHGAQSARVHLDRLGLIEALSNPK